MKYVDFIKTMQDYAAFKYSTGVDGYTRKDGKQVRDLGAVNDLYEILVRLAFVGDYRLVRDTMLHVKKQGKTDIVSRGIIRYEVGFNGKTWQEGTKTHPLEGKFEGVIYGMIDTDIRDSIFEYIAEGNVKDAIILLASYTYIWYDKAEALIDLEGIPLRGKFFTIKNGRVMNNYNAGLQKRFTDAEFQHGELLIDRITKLNY